MINVTTLVENCYNALPVEMRRQPWKYTDHGRKVLNSEEELNAYLAAYGEIHIVKCYAALQNFPFEDLKVYSYEIFDWGCGQGVATLTLLDMLRERNLLSGLKKITLVEPSLPALKRAKQWTEHFANPGVDVFDVNKFIPSSEVDCMDEISCATQVSINLMSNILDVKSISLKWLAKKTSTLAVRNYMICVGPKFGKGTNTRIDDFCGYFNKPDYFSAISAYPYAYTTKFHHPFGLETRCFLHQKGVGIINSYSECAKEEDFSDDYEYATTYLKGIVSDNLFRLYNVVRTKCQMSYDIFLRPTIGSDIVDLVLTNVGKGIVLLNVCEDIKRLEAEFRRIRTIKSHIFDVVLKTIKYDSIINKSAFNYIKVGLYIPNVSDEEMRKSISDVNKSLNKNINNKENQEEKNFFEHFIFLSDNEDSIISLNQIKFKNFKSYYYDEFVNTIVGDWHSYKDGSTNFKLSKMQEKIVGEQNKRIRYKGIAGCGKTQIVANRAVMQHLRTGEKVLIITFNITLIQYIRMRIMQVQADFSTSMFEIVNYHQFFKSKANLYINKKLTLADWDDKNFFSSVSDKIQRYKTIIIDEVQDFKEEWLYSIITYFLTEDGSISLFGDGEQNIYDREMEKESKMPPMRDMKFLGRWSKINERISMRIQNPQIATLASLFAKQFVSSEIQPILLQENLFDKYFVKYWIVDSEKSKEDLAKNIKWIIDIHNLKTKDVVVMAESIKIMRDLAYYYTKETNEKVMLSFESKEQYDEICKGGVTNLKNKDIESVRRAAKTHFTTDCKELKMSTIQSFKGWESDSVILFLEKEYDESNDSDNFGEEKINKPVLIYTALTRAKSNLFIINLGNEKYHEFFKNKVQES